MSSSSPAVAAYGDDHFSKYLLVAFVLHLSVALVIFLRAIILPSEPLAIHDAIRVDVVDLPDKITETPKTLPAAQAVKTPPKAKPAEPVKPPPKPLAPEVDLNKHKPDTAKAESDAFKKLKAMDALAKIKEALAKEKKAQEAVAKPVKGNAVSKGNNALNGLERIAFDQYFDQIKGKVFGNWSIPQWMADRDLKATIVVLIDEQGNVTGKPVIRRSSGNEIFDGKCIEAVMASSPFAPPPERLRGVLSTSGINFNFPQ